MSPEGGYFAAVGGKPGVSTNECADEG